MTGVEEQMRIAHAKINFINGYPHSDVFGDRYFLEGRQGLAEREYVYLLNNEIFERFYQQKNFIIGEIGFGIGLNFLATMNLWMKTQPVDRTLIYISCEMHPLTTRDLNRALSQWKKEIPCTEQLLNVYQTIVPGLNTFVFLEAKMILILLIGEASEELALADFKAHHWMLDGFDPSKNPSAWTDSLIKQISRLSHPEATLATFSAAGFVRRSLQSHGWGISRVKGFAQKRHRLIGCFKGIPTKTTLPPCLVIGSGIAGTSFAFFRSFLNQESLIVDGPWSTLASMVPYAYAHPAVHKAMSSFTLFGLRSHIMSGNFYRQLCKQQGLVFNAAPSMNIADHRRALLFAELSRNPIYENIIHFNGSSITFPQGYSVNGPEILNALSNQSSLRKIQLHDVNQFVKTWKSKHPEHLIVAANSFAFNQQHNKNCTMIRGQLSALNQKGTISWLKGTHERHDFNPLPRKSLIHQHVDKTSHLSDFVGFRSIQRNYLPCFGYLEKNLMVSVYHGSRGFSSGLWCGLILALKSLGLFSYKNDSSCEVLPLNRQASH